MVGVAGPYGVFEAVYRCVSPCQKRPEQRSVGELVCGGAVILMYDLLMGVSAERYFELLKEARVRGYLFEQQNIIPKS